MCPLACKTKTFPILNHRNLDNVRFFLNCNSHNVVYVIHCKMCCKNYVGCIIRKLQKRVSEHLYAIGKQRFHHSGACKHFVEQHNSDTKSLGVYMVQGVPRPSRSGDWRHKLLNREAYWILRLGTWTPGGMNLRGELLYIF